MIFTIIQLDRTIEKQIGMTEKIYQKSVTDPGADLSYIIEVE